MGRLYKKVHVNSQYKLFSILSELYKEACINIKSQGYCFKTYVSQAMKHYDCEHQPIEDLVSFRDQFKIDYQRQLKDLEDRKQDLWKKDPKHWGYVGPNVDLLQI